MTFEIFSPPRTFLNTAYSVLLQCTEHVEIMLMEVQSREERVERVHTLPAPPHYLEQNPDMQKRLPYTQEVDIWLSAL